MSGDWMRVTGACITCGVRLHKKSDRDTVRRRFRDSMVVSGHVHMPWPELKKQEAVDTVMAAFCSCACLLALPRPSTCYEHGYDVETSKSGCYGRGSDYPVSRFL